jgi:hypothetical protein
MDGLTNLAYVATLVFLGALALIVILQALTGKIRLGGLLRNGLADEVPRRLSADRVQLLVVTVLAAPAPLALAGNRNGWPLWLSAGLPVVLAVSNTIYIWSQYRRLRADSHS